MDFLKYLGAVALWGIFYLVVGICAAFGVKIGWEAATTLIHKLRTRTPRIKKGQDNGARNKRPLERTEPLQHADGGGNGGQPAKESTVP